MGVDGSRDGAVFVEETGRVATDAPSVSHLLPLLLLQQNLFTSKCLLQ